MKQNIWAYLFFWYLWGVPKEILRGWGNILWFNLEYFSFFFLLKTLFAPWRRIQWTRGKGFNIGKWFEALTGNIISRLLGSMIRSSLIVVGILIEFLLLFVGPVVFILWFLLPLLLINFLYQGVFVAEFPGLQAYLLLAIFLVGTILLTRSFLRSYHSAIPLSTAKTLAEFLKKEQKSLRFVFARLLMDSKELITRLEAIVPKRDLSILLKSRLGSTPTPEEVVAVAAREDKDFQKVLMQLGVTPKDIENAALWLLSLRQKIVKQGKWWTKKNLRRYGTLGRQWTSGFSPLLDQFSLDLSERVRNQRFPELVGHKKEVRVIERILARDQMNNVLLVGEPGSGRKSIVKELAKKSVLGETLPELNYKRVVELDIPALLSQTESSGEREAALDEIFQEVVRAGNIILVIDEFHNFAGPTGEARPGTLNITGILAKYLSSPRFPIIAITTFTGLHRDIEQNPSILSLLEKVETEEISKAEALLVLQSVTPFFERKYKKFISYQALRDIVELSTKYIQAMPLPKKALNVLEEAMVHISQGKEKILLPKHIAEIISEKTQIPIGEVETKEKEVLLNLEDLIHKRIINQDEGVREVASSLRRARTQIASRKGPMGSFLFLGPTGVGKTETAKALASIYFGSESRMIRLDMSEFQSIKDIDRLLGSPGRESLLTTAVRENPFSLILLDELEKAHGNVLNLFLQILDEGHVTDGLGRKVDFSHTIIIATSNAGYQIILRALKEGMDFALIKQEIFDQLFAQGIFRPEFLNRFDGVILFKPLTKRHLVDIAQLMLAKLQRNLQEKGIEFKITEPLKVKIAELGYNPQFGARDMRRVIQNKVENALATALLRGTMKRGDSIEIDPTTFTIKPVSP
ncbi:ATP-dependent Clp protease ATP-binding subunit [Patescibacteria group bacterium]|nr:ATP-dependent Clp protease ATP-binding subunit [Patescibacteria group bacterium]